MNNNEFIYSEYSHGDVGIGEMLANISISELPDQTASIEDIFNLYIHFMNKIEEDRFYTIKENEVIEL